MKTRINENCHYFDGSKHRTEECPQCKKEQSQPHPTPTWKLSVEGPYPNEKGSDYSPFVKVTSDDGDMVKVFTKDLDRSENLAAFIVRAVNAYDELVGALKVLSTHLHGWNTKDAQIEMLATIVDTALAKSSEKGA